MKIINTNYLLLLLDFAQSEKWVPARWWKCPSWGGFHGENRNSEPFSGGWSRGKCHGWKQWGKQQWVNRKSRKWMKMKGKNLSNEASMQEFLHYFCLFFKMLSTTCRIQLIQIHNYIHFSCKNGFFPLFLSIFLS